MEPISSWTPCRVLNQPSHSGNAEPCTLEGLFFLLFLRPWRRLPSCPRSPLLTTGPSIHTGTERRDQGQQEEGVPDASGHSGSKFHFAVCSAKATPRQLLVHSCWFSNSACWLPHFSLPVLHPPGRFWVSPSLNAGKKSFHSDGSRVGGTGEREARRVCFLAFKEAACLGPLDLEPMGWGHRVGGEGTSLGGWKEK